MIYFSAEEMAAGSNFIMLVGAPGSGKSTLADKISRGGNWVIISPDNIREELTGNPHDKSQDRNVFKIVYAMLEERLRSGDNVIYDATNYNTKYRTNVMYTVGKFANKTICLVATATLLQCLINNESREYQVPAETVEKMYLSLKMHQPSISEGYDAIARF